MGLTKMSVIELFDVIGGLHMKGRYLTTAIAACVISFTVGLGTTCLGFFVLPVTKEYGFPISAFVLHISILFLASAVGLMLAPKILGKFGMRKLVVINGVIAGAGFAGFSLCTNVAMFYVISAIVGVLYFAGSMYVIPMLLNNWFVKAKGTLMGISMAFSGVCGALMGLILPGIITSAGYRTGYVVLGVIEAAFMLYAGIFLVRDKPEDCGLKPYGWEEATSAAGAKSGASPATGFTLKELMGKWQFWVMVAGFLLYNIVSTVNSNLNTHYRLQGIDPVHAGWLVSILMAVMIVVKIGEGIASDKLGAIKTMIICCATSVIAFLILPQTSFGMLVIAVCILSIGASSINVMQPLVVQSAVGLKHFPSIWSFMLVVNSIGSFVGTPLYGLSVDITGSYIPAMYIASGVSAVCIVLINIPALSLLKKKKELQA
jgi:MFS family permease